MSLKNKAVLISIRPEWCEKILNGEKTVEIRKNRPSLKMPFKCYIYCTKPVGNVIGEFTCDKIRFYFGKSWLVKEDIEDVTAGSCLSLEQVKEYAGWRKATSFMDRKDLYAWHISDLKIYDQPKSLSGFSRHDFRGMNGTDVCGNESCEHYQPSGSYMLPPTCAINGCCLSKPPQSGCYVAEAKEDDAL